MDPNQVIPRTPLLTAQLGEKQVTTVEIMEINMQPGQIGGLHLHPCPVTGYIASGTAIYQIEGAPPRILEAGSAFYEPAGVRVAQFGNHSQTEPLKFIAFYLLNGPQERIQML